MAGIGFQLKQLFGKEGLGQRLKAIMIAALVTVGPMICCMVAMAVISLMMNIGETPFQTRQLFQSGSAYAFAFSFMITSAVSLFLTRSVSDRLYQKAYHELLPTFYGALQLTLLIASIPAIILLVFGHLPLSTSITIIVLFMTLVIMWMEIVYVSAMKSYRRITIAFLTGMIIAIAGVYTLLKLEVSSVDYLFGALTIGFLTTAALLLRELELFFRTPEKGEVFGFLQDIHRHPSLLVIGLCTGVSMFEHQIAMWLFHGDWVSETFLVMPTYDVAVYYAVLSILPTLIWFVVSLETAFYPKFRQYYDYILGHGTIIEIDRSRKELEKVMLSELSKLMGMQFAFSIFAIALGIRYLPFIGFTAEQIDIYNLLVMSFYAYVMVSILILLLLYFDDRRGAMCVSILFLVSNIISSCLLSEENYHGLSLFAASFPTLLVTLGRLIYRVRRLHYATFSAQPLVNRKTARHEQSEGRI